MPPFKSDSQRRFFHSAGAAKAGITKKEVHEFDESSKGMKLPEHKASGGIVGQQAEHYLADALKTKQAKERTSKLYRGGSVPSDFDTSDDRFEYTNPGFIQGDIDQDEKREAELSHYDEMESPSHYEYEDDEQHLADGGAVLGPVSMNPAMKENFLDAVKKNRRFKR